MCSLLLGQLAIGTANDTKDIWQPLVMHCPASPRCPSFHVWFTHPYLPFYLLALPSLSYNFLLLLLTTLPPFSHKFTSAPAQRLLSVILFFFLLFIFVMVFPARYTCNGEWIVLQCKKGEIEKRFVLSFFNPREGQTRRIGDRQGGGRRA